MKQTLEVIKLELINPNPYQPRTEFNDEKLQSLAESIKEHGLLQPIILLKEKEGYTIVGGERRFRATHLLGLTEIQAKIFEGVEDRDTFLRNGGVVENSQRENLTSKEIFELIINLHDVHKLSFKTISNLFGYKESWAHDRYQAIMNAPKTMAEKILNDEINYKWYASVRSFANGFPMLEDVVIASIFQGRWKNRLHFDDFIIEMKRQNPPGGVLKGIILYPAIFTPKVVEKLSQFDKKQAEIYAVNFIQSIQDAELEMTEEIIIEYLDNVKRKKETTSRVAQLREILSEKETEAKKELEEMERDFQFKSSEIHKKAEEEFKKKKSLLEKQMASVVTDGEIKLTAEQEEELNKLEQDYIQKQNELKEEQKKRAEQAQKEFENKLLENQNKIKELEKQWEKETYQNPLRHGIDFLVSNYLHMEAVAGNWDELNLSYVIEDMPQNEFEHIRDSLDLIVNNLNKRLAQVEKIKEYVHKRNATPVRAIVDREEKKAKFKTVK